MLACFFDLLFAVIIGNLFSQWEKILACTLLSTLLNTFINLALTWALHWDFTEILLTIHISMSVHFVIALLLAGLVRFCRLVIN